LLFLLVKKETAFHCCMERRCSLSTQRPRCVLTVPIYSSIDADCSPSSIANGDYGHITKE